VNSVGEALSERVMIGRGERGQDTAA